MDSVVSQLLSFVFKFLLGLFAVIFAVSLLVAGLFVVALSLLRALFTGQKAAPSAVFGRFQRFSHQNMWPDRSSRGRPDSPSAGEVVDVDAREIPVDRHLP